MKTTIKRICAAIAAVLCIALTAEAATWWRGSAASSNNKNSWWTGAGGSSTKTSSKKLGDGDNFYFRDSEMTGTAYKRKMTLDANATIQKNNMVFFQCGSEAEPFVVTGTGKTLTWNNTPLYVGWNVNGSYDAGLELNGGTYKPKGVEVGSSKTGYLKIKNATLEAGGPFRVTKGKLALDGATITMTSGELLFNNGEVVADNSTISGGLLRLAQTNGTMTVTKNSGNWSVTRMWTSQKPGAKSYFYHRGGNLTTTGTGNDGRIGIGANSTAGTMAEAYFELSGGTVDCTSGTSFNVGLDRYAKGTVLVNGGTLKCKELNVGFNGSGEFTVSNGTINVSSGNVRFAGGENCSGAAMTLAGGIVETKKVEYSTSGTVAATMTFDGGTLKAASGSSGAAFLDDYANLTVSVGEAGGTIDANGENITISEPLTAAADAPGALTLTGGSMITLARAAACPVQVAVDGTIVGVTAASKDSVLSHLTIAIPAVGVADGTLAVTNTTPDAVFSAADVAAVTLSGDQDGRFVLELGDNGTSMRISDTLAGEFVWNDGASGADWKTAGKWSKNNVPGDWHDATLAVFENAGDSTTVGSPVVAYAIDFRADATVSGAGTLTAPSVSVASGVTASIAAPTAGALEKTGAGSLALGSSRTEQTTVSEGTLAMASGATLNPSALTLGTDPAKPVTLDYGTQTLAADPFAYIGAGMDVTLANGVFARNGAQIMFDDTTFPSVLTVARGATLSTDNRFRMNTSTEATINIAGGTLKSTGADTTWIMQASLAGRLNINVTDGGLLEFASNPVMLTCRDTVGGSTAYQDPSLYLRVVDSTFRLTNDKLLQFGYDGSNKNPVSPTGVIAATNSTFDVGAGTIYIGHNTRGKNTAGSYTADFENCVITAKCFKVYHDRDANSARFNNSTLVLTGTDNWSIETHSEFPAGSTPMTIGAGGLTVDTQAFNGTMQADPQGEGALVKTGSGKLTIKRRQTGTGALVSANGEVFIDPGLSVSRPVTVKNGATFTVGSTAQVSLDSLELEDGATLNLDTFTTGVTPLAVSSSLTLPAEGAATLALNGGAFPSGTYAIIEMVGVAAADVVGKLVPSVAAGSTGTWLVSGGTLYLSVSGANEYVWTGAGDGAKFSDGANWSGGTTPVDGASIVIGVSSAATLDCDIADFAPAAITFPATSAAVTIGGANAISGVAAVTNLSSVSHTINVPVYFAGDIQVKQEAMAEIADLSKAHVTFAGGAYAAPGCALESGDPAGAYSRCVFGEYHLASTASNPWSAEYQGSQRRVCVSDGSSLHVPYASSLVELYAGSGANVYVGEITTVRRLLYQMAAGGEVVITNLNIGATTQDIFMTYNQGKDAPGTFKIGRARCTEYANKWIYFGDANKVSKETFFFGKGGIGYEGDALAQSNPCFCFGPSGTDKAGNEAVIRPWNSDFAITGKTDPAKFGIVFDYSVEFNTTDADGVGRTITLDTVTRTRRSPALTVSGTGTLKVNKAANNETQPAVTVKDTATLAFAPGATLGTGKLTVNSGATLALPQTGTVTMGGSLALAAGSTIEFTLSVAGQTTLDVTGKTLALPAAEADPVVVSHETKPGKAVRSKTPYTLISGANLTEDDLAKFTLGVNLPEWVRGENALVVEDGDLKLYTMNPGLCIKIK